MSTYWIVPCTLGHLREIARTMRGDDRAEFERAGYNPRHRLHALWRDTIAPRAALIDGEVAAVWGDAAPLLAAEGLMWLATAPPIERLPLAFFRETRREVAEALRLRRSLMSCIVCPYDRAERFFRMLGFAISEPLWRDGVEYRQIRIGNG